MLFKFSKNKIPEIITIKTTEFKDRRGFFKENYQKSIFQKNGIKECFVQDNYSFSKKNVLRGLHFQSHPKGQGKIIFVISGKIFDVSVDIRKGSPTFGQWVGKILSDKNKLAIYVPQGFAHGFCVLSQEARVIYKTSGEYSPKHEQGIIWNDPELKIHWPVKKPIVSEKDTQWPKLAEADINFIYKKNKNE